MLECRRANGRQSTPSWLTPDNDEASVVAPIVPAAIPMPTEGTVAELAVTDTGFIEAIARSALITAALHKARKKLDHLAKTERQVDRSSDELSSDARAQTVDDSSIARDASFRWGNEQDKALTCLRDDDKKKVKATIQQQTSSVEKLLAGKASDWQPSPSVPIEGMPKLNGQPASPTRANDDDDFSMPPKIDFDANFSNNNDNAGWGGSAAPQEPESRSLGRTKSAYPQVPSTSEFATGTNTSIPAKRSWGGGQGGRTRSEGPSGRNDSQHGRSDGRRDDHEQRSQRATGRALGTSTWKQAASNHAAASTSNGWNQVSPSTQELSGSNDGGRWGQALAQDASGDSTVSGGQEVDNPWSGWSDAGRAKATDPDCGAADGWA